MVVTRSGRQSLPHTPVPQEKPAPRAKSVPRGNKRQSAASPVKSLTPNSPPPRRGRSNGIQGSQVGEETQPDPIDVDIQVVEEQVEAPSVVETRPKRGTRSKKDEVVEEMQTPEPMEIVQTSDEEEMAIEEMETRFVHSEAPLQAPDRQTLLTAEWERSKFNLQRIIHQVEELENLQTRLRSLRLDKGHLFMTNVERLLQQAIEAEEEWQKVVDKRSAEVELYQETLTGLDDAKNAWGTLLCHVDVRIKNLDAEILHMNGKVQEYRHIVEAARQVLFTEFPKSPSPVKQATATPSPVRHHANKQTEHVKSPQIVETQLIETPQIQVSIVPIEEPVDVAEGGQDKKKRRRRRKKTDKQVVPDASNNVHGQVPVVEVKVVESLKPMESSSKTSLEKSSPDKPQEKTSQDQNNTQPRKKNRSKKRKEKPVEEKPLDNDASVDAVVQKVMEELAHRASLEPMEKKAKIEQKVEHKKVESKKVDKPKEKVVEKVVEQVKPVEKSKEKHSKSEKSLDLNEEKVEKHKSDKKDKDKSEDKKDKKDKHDKPKGTSHQSKEMTEEEMKRAKEERRRRRKERKERRRQHRLEKETMPTEAQESKKRPAEDDEVKEKKKRKEKHS